MKKLRQVLTILLAVALIVSVTGNSGAIALAAEGDSSSVATESVEPAAAKEKEDAAEGAASESGKEEEAQTEAGAKEEKEAADQSEEEKKEPEKGEEKSEQSTAEKDSEQLDYEAVKKVKALFEALPKAENVSKMTEAELESAVKDTEQALDALEALGEKESDYFQTEEAELYQAVTVELCEALAKVADDGVAPMSLLPLKEEKVYLTLLGYTQKELEQFSLVEMLGMLQDADGKAIEIDKSATKVWKYVKSDDDSIEKYETYTIEENETINLYPGDNISAFQMELIVGTGGQLNSSNKRYVVKVYFKDIFEDNIELEIYSQQEDGTRSKVTPMSCKYWSYMDQAGIEELNYDFSIKEDLSKSGTAWLNIKSELANDPRVTVEVYPTISDGTYIYVLKNPITNEILNQDMEKTGKGFQISGEHNDGEKFFIRVFVDGKQYDQKFIVMRNWNWYPYYEGKMYVIQDEKKQNLSLIHI